MPFSISSFKRLNCSQCALATWNYFDTELLRLLLAMHELAVGHTDGNKEIDVLLSTTIYRYFVWKEHQSYGLALQVNTKC